MGDQYTEQQDAQDSKEAEKKRGGSREGQKQDSFWGDEDLVKEFQEYVKEHGFVKTEVYEGMIRRWLDRQKNGIDTGEYKQSSLDFETILAQAQRMYDESLGARAVLVKAHKEQMDAINASRLAAEAEVKKVKADREDLIKKLSEAEADKNDAVEIKNQFKATYEDWKRRAEEAQEAKMQAEAETESLAKDLLKTRTELEKISAEKELYSNRIKNLESALKEEKLGRKADAEMAEKRQQEAVKTALESAKIDLRLAVAEQRERDADRLEEERQKHANTIAAMQEKIDLARQNQGKAETELNAVIRLKSETEAELQRTQEALAKVLGEK